MLHVLAFACVLKSILSRPLMAGFPAFIILYQFHSVNMNNKKSSLLIHMQCIIHYLYFFLAVFLAAILRRNVISISLC